MKRDIPYYNEDLLMGHTTRDFNNMPLLPTKDVDGVITCFCSDEELQASLSAKYMNGSKPKISAKDFDGDIMCVLPFPKEGTPEALNAKCVQSIEQFTVTKSRFNFILK